MGNTVEVWAGECLSIFSPMKSNQDAIIIYSGKLSHFVQYGFIIVMPATGITMGYYGGRGLPFFGWAIWFQSSHAIFISSWCKFTLNFLFNYFLDTQFPGERRTHLLQDKLLRFTNKLVKSSSEFLYPILVSVPISFILRRYLTVVHVGAVGYHLVKGQSILARMGIGAVTK